MADDTRFATDTASLDGDEYEWSTGYTGSEGRSHAVVHHITGCKGDTSPIIKPVRNA